MNGRIYQLQEGDWTGLVIGVLSALASQDDNIAIFNIQGKSE